MKIELEKVLYAVAGIVVTGVFSMIAFFYRRNLERKKAVNEALFNLLELRHIVATFKRADSEEAVQHYIGIVKRRFPEVATNPEVESWLQALLVKLMREQINHVLEHIVGPDASRFSNWYFDALRNLASVEPVLAHQLSGNRNIHALLESIDIFLSTIGDGVNSETSSQDSDDALRTIRKHVSNLAVKDIDVDIRRLAWKSSRRNYLRIFWKEYRNKDGASKMKQEIERFANDYFDEVMGPTANRESNPLIPWKSR